MPSHQETDPIQSYIYNCLTESLGSSLEHVKQSKQQKISSLIQVSIKTLSRENHTVMIQTAGKITQAIQGKISIYSLIAGLGAKKILHATETYNEH